nr:MAG TPA: hypothetical protein [Caudoviricetes sp.]
MTGKPGLRIRILCTLTERPPGVSISLRKIH